MVQPEELIVHYLKCHQGLFIDVQTEYKKFELRRDDRKPLFKISDILFLKETAELPSEKGVWEKTGRELMVSIEYILRGHVAEEYGLKEGFCALGIRRLPELTFNYYRNSVILQDEKTGVIFLDSPGVDIVFGLTKTWLESDWDSHSNPPNKGLVKIILIRAATKWYIEEEIEQRNWTFLEQAHKFEKWMGW